MEWFEIANVAVLFVQLIMAAFFLYNLLTPKYSYTICYLCFCIAMIPGIYIYVTGVAGMQIHQVIQIIFFVLVSRLLCEDSWKMIFFAVSLCCIFHVLNDILVELLLPVMIPNAHNYSQDEVLFIESLFFCLFFFVSTYFVVIFWKKKKQQVLSRSVFLILLFPISQFFIWESVVEYNIFRLKEGAASGNALIFVIMGVILCFLADLIVLQVVFDNSEKERLKIRMEMMKRQHKTELVYYNTTNERIEEIGQIRHDLNIQLQNVYLTFIEGKREEDVVGLLNNLEKQIEKITPIYFCANSIVNAVLFDKYQICQKEGIELQTEINIPEEISIMEIDLCSVFANLLDNSIHAAAECTERKSISLKAYLRSGYCVIKVDNTMNPMMDYKKKRIEKDMHGYGLLILNSIAEKYRGEFKYEKMNDHFQAVVKLEMQG